MASRKLGRHLTGAERAELMELSDYKEDEFHPRRADEVVKDPSVKATGNGTDNFTDGLFPRRVFGHLQSQQRYTGGYPR